MLKVRSRVAGHQDREDSEEREELHDSIPDRVRSKVEDQKGLSASADVASTKEEGEEMIDRRRRSVMWMSALLIPISPFPVGEAQPLPETSRDLVSVERRLHSA